MRNRLLFFFLFCCSLSSIGFAQDNSDSSERPWMKGAEHVSENPAITAPVVKMIISDENGVVLPKEVSEDAPLLVMANSDIFYEDPVSKSVTSSDEFSQAQWIDKKAKALWFINDWANNKSYRAKTSKSLAANQMEIIPINPTDNGAISCFCSRKMSYIREEDGRKIYCYATSSDMRGFKVKDITPPTCGLDISIEGGKSGSCWPVENPPNHFPLPKTADVCFQGDLFNASEEPKVVEGFELGANMVVSKEEAISLRRTDKIRVKVIGDDNYKLNREKLKYAICGGGGGEPAPVSPVNEEEIDFSKFLVPENPYLYLDASDMAGNRQVLFIPINIIE